MENDTNINILLSTTASYKFEITIWICEMTCSNWKKQAQCDLLQRMALVHLLTLVRTKCFFVSKSNSQKLIGSQFLVVFSRKQIACGWRNSIISMNSCKKILLNIFTTISSILSLFHRIHLIDLFQKNFNCLKFKTCRKTHVSHVLCAQ